MKTSISRHFFLLTLDFSWKVRFCFQFQFIVFPYKLGAFLQDSPFCASAQNTSLFLYISNKSASLSSTFFSFSFLYPGTALFFFIFGKVAFLSAKKELQIIDFFTAPKSYTPLAESNSTRAPRRDSEVQRECTAPKISALVFFPKSLKHSKILVFSS